MRTQVALHATLLIALTVVSPVLAEEVSPQEVLEAWGKDYVGTWESSTTLDVDVPGLGEKGDRLTEVGTVARNDGVYVVNTTTSIDGKPVDSNHGIAGWDPQKKRVRLEIFSKHGSATTIIYNPSGDSWTARVVSTAPDGTKSTSNGTLEKSAHEHVWTMTRRMHGDQTLPDKKRTYTKQ